MSKTPKKIKQWAKEAIEAMEVVVGIISEGDYDGLSHEERMAEYVNFAPAIAGLKRGLKNNPKMSEAHSFVLKRITEDFSNTALDDDPEYEMLFLLAYLDANVYLGFLSESKSEDVMEFIVNNYEVPTFA